MPAHGCRTRAAAADYQVCDSVWSTVRIASSRCSFCTRRLNSQILTTVDVEREIALWRKRSGKEFWM
jgi:hypothetical protein